MTNNSIDPKNESSQISDELSEKELENVAGGGFLGDVVDTAKDFFGNVFERGKDFISDVGGAFDKYLK
jgi:bacteriocin-like protein